MNLFYGALERGQNSYAVQEIKPLLRRRVSDEDLITAVSKAAGFEKERNLALGKKRQVKVYEVGSDKLSNSHGNSDNKVDKLVSSMELLNKQVSTLQSEINNIKGDGYKKNVSDNFSSGDRKGRNIILCKNCKDNNRSTCNHCFKYGLPSHLARGCFNPSSRNQGNQKRLVVLGNQQPQTICSKSATIAKNYNLRNAIVAVVVNMFIFVGKNASLGTRHTTKLYVHL